MILRWVENVLASADSLTFLRDVVRMKYTFKKTKKISIELETHFSSKELSIIFPEKDW